MRQSRGKLIWILLAAVVVLLVVAMAAGGVYVLLQRQQSRPQGWQDPIAAVASEQLVPALALYPLAGASEVETIDEAIATDHLETAYSTLVFGLNLSDVQRIGRLTLLGQRFAGAEQEAQAGLCYQQIYDLALLSPVLSDAARTDALLSSGRGWAAIEGRSQALNAFDQAYTLVLHSPYLPLAHRRELLIMLEAAYLDLEQVDGAQACRQQILEWDRQPEPQGPAEQIEVPDLPKGEEAVSSPEVGALEEARRQAAYGLLQALLDGGQASPVLVDGLTQALLAEDAAKLQLYDQELAATTQPGKRINVHWHLIRWLTIKYQVAAGGLGLSVVPEWEGRYTEIQSALSKAYEGLYFDYEDLVTALPQASAMGPGSYQSRRLITLAGQLGHYPNYPAEQMAGKVQDAALELIASGAREQVYVDVAVEEGELDFFLRPADQYGLPAESP